MIVCLIVVRRYGDVHYELIFDVLRKIKRLLKQQYKNIVNEYEKNIEIKNQIINLKIFFF